MGFDFSLLEIDLHGHGVGAEGLEMGIELVEAVSRGDGVGASPCVEVVGKGLCARCGAKNENEKRDSFIIGNGNWQLRLPKGKCGRCSV